MWSFHRTTGRTQRQSGVSHVLQNIHVRLEVFQEHVRYGIAKHLHGASATDPIGAFRGHGFLHRHRYARMRFSGPVEIPTKREFDRGKPARDARAHCPLGNWEIGGIVRALPSVVVKQQNRRVERGQMIIGADDARQTFEVAPQALLYRSLETHRVVRVQGSRFAGPCRFSGREHPISAKVHLYYRPRRALSLKPLEQEHGQFHGGVSDASRANAWRRIRSRAAIVSARWQGDG
jgi:hypothetical protein